MGVAVTVDVLVGVLVLVDVGVFVFVGTLVSVAVAGTGVFVAVRVGVRVGVRERSSNAETHVVPQPDAAAECGPFPMARGSSAPSVAAASSPMTARCADIRGRVVPPGFC